MSAIRERRQDRLRFGIGVSGPDARTQSGVLVFTDIPPGTSVHAQVDRPTELLGDGFSTPGELSDGGAGATPPATQPYRFEKAQFPAQFITTGGVTFPRPNSLNRVYTTDGKGVFMPTQEVPAFVVFAPVQDGALVQRGRKEHFIPMPGGTAGNILTKDRSILRLRWTGTVVAGEVQVSPPLAPNVPNGTTRKFTGQLGNLTPAINIVPGSVAIVASAVGGNAVTIRDDGAGRLAGIHRAGTGQIDAAADGTIDYLTGKYELNFGAAGLLPAPDVASTFTAGYEKNCGYKPLDVNLSWDALLQ